MLNNAIINLYSATNTHLSFYSECDPRTLTENHLKRWLLVSDSVRLPGNTQKNLLPGPYFIKVKILSLKFKINLTFYLIKEFMKHSCLNFFHEIVNKISIKVKRNWNLKNSPRLKDDQFFLNPDFKKIVTFMK